MGQVVFNSFKRERIQRDQLFLNLHNLTFINFIKQSLQLLLDNIQIVDPTCMKVNLPRDVGCYDSYNLILLPIDDKILLVILSDLEP
jgi:hypothetical protein